MMLIITFIIATWIHFLFTTLLCAVAIVCGALITRKFLSFLFIVNDDIPIVNIIIRQISTLLSVLMAFAVISIWQDYETQRKNTAQEAIIMGNIYRDSRGFNKETENKIQGLLINYTKAIVEDSWPKMKEKKESEIAWNTFNSLYGYTIRLNPGNSREEIVYKNTVSNLNELAKYRRLRHLRNSNPYIPDIIWGTIYLSTVLILFSGFLLRMQNKLMQIIMTSISALIFGMVFSLLLLLNQPYSGSLQISPNAIENLLSDVYPASDLSQLIKQKR